MIYFSINQEVGSRKSEVRSWGTKWRTDPPEGGELGEAKSRAAGRESEEKTTVFGLRSSDFGLPAALNQQQVTSN